MMFAMLEQVTEQIHSFMQRGGLVMYPLLLTSVASITLVFERAWFFVRTNNAVRRGRFRQVAKLLRDGHKDRAADLIGEDRSVYGEVVRQLLVDGVSEAAVTDAVESQRGRLDRFMPTLGTIITAAPMLGILGTVTGIISSFRVLSHNTTITDPSLISAGIAEALLTTVAGLIIALTVLFPYNIYRAQIDRTLGLIDSLVAAMEHGGIKARPVPKPSSEPVTLKA
jgi:biopolymer transport protein ExbB